MRVRRHHTLRMIADARCARRASARRATWATRERASRQSGHACDVRRASRQAEHARDVQHARAREPPSRGPARPGIEPGRVDDARRRAAIEAADGGGGGRRRVVRHRVRVRADERTGAAHGMRGQCARARDSVVARLATVVAAVRRRARGDAPDEEERVPAHWGNRYNQIRGCPFGGRGMESTRDARMAARPAGEARRVLPVHEKAARAVGFERNALSTCRSLTAHTNSVRWFVDGRQNFGRTETLKAHRVAFGHGARRKMKVCDARVRGGAVVSAAGRAGALL
jgi:hypothetical protein